MNLDYQSHSNSLPRRPRAADHLALYKRLFSSRGRSFLVRISSKKHFN